MRVWVGVGASGRGPSYRVADLLGASEVAARPSRVECERCEAVGAAALEGHAAAVELDGDDGRRRVGLGGEQHYVT